MSITYYPHSIFAKELRPEAILLLGCARTRIAGDAIEHLKKLAAGRLDWEFLCASAEKHRLTQLLYKNLTSICPDAVPDQIRGRLRYQFNTNAGSNLKLAHTLTALLKKFEAENIPVIPYKGSILANCTYGKLALRQNYDIDLFIREKDIQKSSNLLASDKYSCEEAFDREKRFRNRKTEVEVDLHWGFAPRFFHLRHDFDRMYERAQTVSLMGQSVITFSSEDLLLILCLQVMKDCWERQQQLEHLSKVCDIAEHLRAHRALNWLIVIQNAKNQGLLRILHCSLILAHELLGADLPQPILEMMRSDNGARKRAQWMCRSLFTDSDTLSPLENRYLAMRLRLRQLFFYFGIRERYRDRIKHVGEIFRTEEIF
jgi:hypothetical protein